ncbi:RCC1 like beta propeller protein [Cryptosporidium canis]|uniref:RCC1 like beta propeller protein n=1 Tax=Cryptosporidium canis TaxID=195482 RepID=A0ABQ8P7H5_9CRYT|nr:RCC1 like beta propeller protein [Cryptosporidium canis]KAJ1615045.1 RCC1 like beta propeller protein [Cryptosporidium canis]
MYSNAQYQNTKNEYLITTSDYLLDLNRPLGKKTTISVYRGHNNIETIHTLGKKKILQVSSGINHVLLLTSDNEVYSFGTGIFGQLGHGESIHKLKEPKKIQHIEGVTKITAGSYSSIALTSKGEVYRWGLYDLKSPAVFKPKLETFFGGENKVVEVESYKEKTCIALDNGEIYAWDFHSPRMELICRLSNTIVRQISIGAYFTLVLDSDSQLFVWGDNTFGEFGENDLYIYDPDFPNFSRLKIEAWGLSTRNSGSRSEEREPDCGVSESEGMRRGLNGHSREIYIEKISCGEKHCLILTSINSVLCMGDNTYGQCGVFDDKKSIYPPITLKKFSELDMLKPFISCGNRSSAIISPNGKLFLCGRLFGDSKSNKKIGVSRYADKTEDLNRLSTEYSIIHKNSSIIDFNDKTFIVISN